MSKYKKLSYDTPIPATPEKAFTADGYIADQDYFSEFVYRTIGSDINGCGWIAVFNFMKAQGLSPDFNQIRLEMDTMHFRRHHGPTTLSVLRRYLKKYCPDCMESRGKKRSFSAMKDSSAGILLYLEEKIPHYIAFVRQPDGNFRFFNVADGLEDCLFTPEEFFRTHIPGRLAVTFTIGGTYG